MVGTDVAAGPAAAGGTETRGSALDSGRPAEHTSRRRPFGLWAIPVLVFVIGVVITTTLAVTAHVLHDNNEDRLLRQRVNEAAAVIMAASSGTQSPLSSAAIVAEATNADRAEFMRLMKPLTARGPFVSASIWSTDPNRTQPLFVVGATPDLAREPKAEIQKYIERTGSKSTLAVLNLLSSSPRRLGYGFSTGPNARYVIYAESARPQNRRATVDSNTAFADVDYAIYLGPTDDPRQLLAASVVDPAFGGRTAASRVPFGDSSLYLVMTPRRALGGDLLVRLPWLILGVGFVLSFAAALLTDRLVRRRVHAEELAHLNALLASEQRSVAQTLQHSLLPDELPTFPGLEFAVRYVPGVDGVDVGGDWYDVIGVGDGHVIVVVGDVSGRGLKAATVMASLRYSIRAYAVQGDPPETILFKLSQLIDVRRDGHFATVLCGLVDVANRRVTYANAGHPSPLLIDATGASFVATEVGAPVGVADHPSGATPVTVPPDGVLLAYTDGLFERRGESPDAGLERLRSAAVGYHSLDELLDGLLHELTPDGGNDDTAIMAVKWLA